MEKEILMQARGITKEFKATGGIVHAVSGVDLDIYAGETLALVGESGCGKSTLGKVLLRLIPPTAGSIQFDGEDLTAMNNKQLRQARQKMQLIFQDPYASLDPRMNVGQIIAEPLRAYKIYKNGMPATVGDIRQYDVATYDSASKILYISDLKLTGIYENVSPSPKAPVSITVLGRAFDVLPEATNDLQNFKIGDMMTLLLTNDGKVAGVVTTAAAKGNAVGYVESITEDGKATVQLLDSVLGKVEGKTSYRKDSATKMMGELVTVSSNKQGQLTLTRLTGGSSSGVTGKLDVAARTLGGTPLADNVAVYEKVGSSKLQPVKYSQITAVSVPASKILYASKDYAGRYNVLVLDDVTGDLYTYGFMSKGTMTTPSSMGEIVNSTVIVTTSDKNGETKLELVGGVEVPRNAIGGVVASLNTLQDKNKIAGYVFLKELDGVRRSAFDMKAKTVTTTDMMLPISDNVVCYNKTTGKWFAEHEEAMDNLNEARAFSDNITIYYDRAPEDGGKVRMVVVQ